MSISRMMNLKKNTIGVVLLGIFALGFALHAEAQGVISPFCTEGNVTPEMKAFCTKLVGGAKTWDQAALTSVKRITKRSTRSMKEVLGIIEAKLSPTMHITKKFQILDACRNSYEEALKDLKSCPALISVGPFSSYGSTLTSVYTSIEDCKDAITEEKDQPEIVEVTKFTASVQRLIDVALIVSKKDPRVADYNERLRRGDFKDSAGDPSLIGPLTPTPP